MTAQPFTIESKIEILEKNIPVALEYLRECTVCPRQCLVDRTAGEIGECGLSSKLKISSSNLHFGEEPPISGVNGSGTIFLSGCNLHCIYCQNYPISQFHNGEYFTVSEVAAKMIALQRRGAHNVNFVTPSHCVPLLMEAILYACKYGLTIPLVYNSSGYDSLGMLKLLDGVIDIYMPDMRYADSKYSKQYSGVPDYPSINQKAIKEMHRQVGILKIVNGVAVKGLLIRHLVLPGGISGSAEIFKFIAREISPHTYVALMSQYFPAFKAIDQKTISRRISSSEYNQALEAFEECGLSNGYIQPFLG